MCGGSNYNLQQGLNPERRNWNPDFGDDSEGKRFTTAALEMNPARHG
jgi:hypothetical protein